MKKYIIPLLFTLLLFLSNKPNVNAQWLKYENNPVLTASSDQSDGQKVWSPSVIYENGIYQIWYQGYKNNKFSIYYAESTDGINWNKNDGAIIAPRTDKNEIGAAEPTVLYINNEYKMWYNAVDSNSRYHLGYAVSSNGINWDIYESYVLEGSGGSWDSIGITNPYIYFDGLTYHLWYSSSNIQSNWKIGYAYSNDGINWEKYEENPLNIPSLGFTEAPSIIKINDVFHMWYNTGYYKSTNIFHATSIDKINWECEDSCYVIQIGESYDNREILSSSVLKIGSKLSMWYSSDNGTRHISYAEYKLTKDTIVIIPGIFASWNKQALLHNENVSIYDWKLNSVVTEYNGLINSLNNAQYIKNQDYYIFPYDWRKNIEDSSDNLDDFINEKILKDNENTKITIIGHSLGGLIGRIWTQKHGNNNISKLISVGSPHKGSPETYRPLEAGEIERKNTFMWLAQKIIIILNKSGIETDKKTIQNRFPVLYDLFPLFPFLKTSDGEYINNSELSIQNILLNEYNSSIDDIQSIFFSIYGANIETLAGYIIKPADPLQNILGNYIDGQPNSVLYDNGDGTALEKTANINLNSYEYNLNHNEIVYKKGPIKKMFEIANIEISDENISEGARTIISPSLIFFIKSPANIEVLFNENKYIEKDGMIFIPNAETGQYKLNIKGIDKGEYTVIIGQITNENDIWDTINGEIVKEPPNSQIDSYIVSFNAEKAQSVFPESSPTPTPEITTTITPTPTISNFPFSTTTPSPSPITISPSSTPPSPTITHIPTPTDKPEDQNNSVIDSNLSNTPTPSNSYNVNIQASNEKIKKKDKQISKNIALKTNQKDVLGLTENNDPDISNQEKSKNDIENKENNNILFPVFIIIIIALVIFIIIKYKLTK